jgi:rubrerythrin
MQLTNPKTLRRRRERLREAPARHEAQSKSETRSVMSVSQVRARRGSGPEDRALYSCECGFAWTGEVSASPSCPHCGTPQAW